MGKVRLFTRLLRRVLTRKFFALLAFALLVVGIWLMAGILAACITLGLGGLLALQLWVALAGKGDLLNAHVLRGPPDGG